MLSFQVDTMGVPSLSIALVPKGILKTLEIPTHVMIDVYGQSHSKLAAWLRAQPHWEVVTHTYVL